MKVLLFTSSISLDSGGTGFEVVNLASTLSSDNRFDVTILTYKRNSPYYTCSPSVKLILLEANSNPFRIVQDSLLVRRLFCSADVILATGIWGILDGLVLRVFRPLSTRCYIRVCGMLETYILKRNAWKKAIGRILYVNSNLSRADGLIVNSKCEASQVGGLGFKSPIHVLVNGFDRPPSLPSSTEAREALDLSMNTRTLLYLGRIHPKKGLHKILPPLIKYIKCNPNCGMVTLLVAGGFSSDKYQRKIRDSISSLPWNLDVRILGDTRGYAKELLLAASDVFMLPSESEGLPNAALEALSRGKPVALTKGCNLPEVSIYGAGIVFSLDDEGIHSALKWMLGPIDVLLRSGALAGELFDDLFSSRTMLRQYQDLICRSTSQKSL